MITAGEAVHARFPNVRLQKRGNMKLFFLPKISAPEECSGDRHLHVAPEAEAREAHTLSGEGLAGNEPAVLFHLIRIQQSHPTSVRLMVGSDT